MKPINYKMVNKPPESSFSIRHVKVPHTFDRFHFHKEYEIHCSINNNGTRFVGDSIRRFDKGDLVLVGPYLPHCWISEDRFYRGYNNLKAEVIVIQFVENFLSDYFTDLPEMKNLSRLFHKAKYGICFKGNDSNKIRGMITKVSQKRGWKKLLLMIEVLCLMGESKEYELLASLSFTKSSSYIDQDSISSIFNYIMLNYQKELSLNKIASHFNMTPSAFCRYFKKLTSRTLSQVINEIRIGFACQEIIKTDKSISEISYDCGYMNVPYFNRVFKEMKGITPLIYKQMYFG